MVRTLMVLGVVLAACAPSTKVVAQPLRALELGPATSATLVIGNFGGWRAVNLVDEDGRVLGQLAGRSVIAIPRPPGSFKLYAVPERDGAKGDRIEGSVEAGQVYYVSVGLRYGGAAMTRSTPFDRSLDAVSIDAAGRDALTAELGNTHALTAQIDETVGRFDEAGRLARHIDGESAYPRPGAEVAAVCE
jgi:hypothetical protein